MPRESLGRKVVSTYIRPELWDEIKHIAEKMTEQNDAVFSAADVVEFALLDYFTDGGWSARDKAKALRDIF